jgi:hypothetical protein
MIRADSWFAPGADADGSPRFRGLLRADKRFASVRALMDRRCFRVFGVFGVFGVFSWFSPGANADGSPNDAGRLADMHGYKYSTLSRMSLSFRHS